MSGLRTDEALRGDRIVVGRSPPARSGSGSRILAANEKLLFFLFLLTLPLANPWVRGDGVGYYAYLRSALIDHDLRFENDYLAANESFVISHVDAQGRLLPRLYTKTGYVENHFSVGPAILWAPVILAVHGTVVLGDHFGAHVAADGYSSPYLQAMAFTTACYGFLSLFLTFRIARKYFDRRLTFLATVWSLDGKFLADLYVFQSLVVACSFRIHRCAVSLVLGTNQVAANGPAMDHFGIDGRIDGKCLLSKCHCIHISCT